MGKRPYFVITVTKDCDGYESWLEYVGSNYAAALDRYKSLVQSIRQHWFIEEGDAPDHINLEQGLPREGEKPRPGQVYRTWINNDDTCWMTVELHIVETGRFKDTRCENEYKLRHPNSKY